jgi:hypothetical protein
MAAYSKEECNKRHAFRDNAHHYLNLSRMKIKVAGHWLYKYKTVRIPRFYSGAIEPLQNNDGLVMIRFVCTLLV